MTRPRILFWLTVLAGSAACGWVLSAGMAGGYVMAFANAVGTLLLVLPGREKRAFYTAVFTGISSGGFLLLAGIISWGSRREFPFGASEILPMLMIIGWFVGLPTLFAASLTWIERRLNR